MEKLSGLILDVYDDTAGEVLGELFPSGLPEMLKEGRCLTAEERSQLPADVFALELVDGERALRKFACVDRGNTWLSVQYFLKTAYKLPPEAQKTAAANLRTACCWYGIEPPPSLEKLALGPGAVLVAVTLPSQLKGAKEQIDQNLMQARMSGRVINPAILTPKPPLPQQ